MNMASTLAAPRGKSQEQKQRSTIVWVVALAM